MSLDDIVNISITTTSKTASRKGFGTPMFARFHNYFADTVRSYTGTAAMLADGFTTDDPAYLMAQAAFEQDPSVTRVKIGKRATAPAQIVDLTPVAPTTGLQYHVTVDGTVINGVAPVGFVLSDMCTALAAQINTAAITDNPTVGDPTTKPAGAIIATGVSTTGIQTITGAGLNGIVGATAFTPPRRLAFIFSSHADWDATTAVVTGKNSRGQVITENFLIPNNGNATVNGVKEFVSITQVVIPAQSGTGGTYTLGLIARTENVDGTAIVETGASAISPQVLTETSLDGDIGTLVISPPRMLELILNSHTDWDATTATVKGTDPSGNAISDTFAIPNNGAAIVKGVKVFKTVTEVDIPAQTGTNGTFALGTQARVIADGTSGTKVRCTTQTAGVIIHYRDWINTQGGTDTISVFDATSDPGIATDLATILLADSDWYGLAIDSNTKAEILAAAAWAESQKIIFACQSADSACADSASTTDVMASLKSHSYARTHCDYHPSIGENWMAAAILGNRLPRDPGSNTWAFKTLAGIEVYSLSDTKLNAIKNKNGGVYIDIAGIDITQNGQSASGQFVDITIFVDWLHARMQERIFTIIANAEKIPFTDKSVAMFVAEILAQLQDGVTVGGLISGTISASGPKVADVPQADRANRHLPNLTFAGQLAGAVHSLTIQGNVFV